MLVTLEQVKLHLRYDDDSNDTYLNMLIKTAETVIKKHIDADMFNESNEALQQAALLLIGFWDNNRNAEDDKTDFYLPNSVLWLLVPYRTPVGV